jgi:cellulose synthase/poly-beta-1,6-N-acetylglucosamine synthase-like glycosyltransferase
MSLGPVEDKMIRNGIITGILIFCLLAAFLLLTPSKPSYLAYAVGAACAVVIVIHYVTSTATKKSRVGTAAFWIPLLSLSLLVIFLPVFFAAILYLWGELSFFTWIFLISLTIIFYYNFLTVPLAIYHKHQEAHKSGALSYCPSVSILIPAFNEEKVLRKTVEAVLEASYPHKEIIVIDDGSTDRTHQIARSFCDSGVKVIHRPNGGKAVALNHGLQFARGEVIVIIDADSLVGKNALVELVQPFQDPEVAAVAGNIKVLNRKNWLTKCQALEYVASINLYRRALDVFGSVTVVPGALGAYRRDILEGSGFYDPDTLVEDFDVTMKALKTVNVVQASAEASSYTEAPQTLGGFIKQRLRWYRGNFQALWKHHDAALNSRYGFLQKLAFPYMAITMTFLPFAGLVTIGSAVLIILNGAGITLVPTFLFFCSLQFLLCMLTIQLDDEDKKLALYSPFFIFGYKQLCDFILIKGLIDVLFRRGLKWTSAPRIGAEISRSSISS